MLYKYLGKGLTYDNSLTKVGKALLGDRYLGTFSVDVTLSKINKLAKLQPIFAFIINVDKRHEPGSHWISVVKKGDMFYIYDSFARKLPNLIPKFLKTVKYKYTHVNGKSDQYDHSENCGQRSLAVLLYGFKYGISRIKDI